MASGKQRTATPKTTKAKAPKKRHRETVDAVAITERRLRVAQYISAGMGFREIAKQEKVSLGTIANDKREILKEWQFQFADEWSDHLLIDLKRVDDGIQRLYAQLNRIGRARSGDLDVAADFDLDREEREIVALRNKLLERRAAMVGYDAKDRRHVPIKLPDLEPAIEVSGKIVDGDGNRVTDKSPAARVHALLGGRRQSGAGGRSEPLPEDPGGGE